MQKASIILLYLLIISSVYSQDYDFIATNRGDSIACRIDSITDAVVYLKMKYNNKWVHTNINRDEVTEYKYNAIQKKAVIFRPGTSYILQYDTPDVYLGKALKLQRSGKIVTIAGASTIGATLLTIIVFGDALELAGVAVAIFGGSAGLTTMIVGIPMNVTGKNRVKQINSMKNTAIKNDVIIDMKPCAQYNLVTQNFQPGIMFRIRF